MFDVGYSGVLQNSRFKSMDLKWRRPFYHSLLLLVNDKRIDGVPDVFTEHCIGDCYYFSFTTTTAVWVICDRSTALARCTIYFRSRDAEPERPCDESSQAGRASVAADSTMDA